MSIVLILVMKHWKALIIVAIIAGGIGYWNLRERKINKLERANADLQEIIDTQNLAISQYQLAIDNLASTIETQNNQIKELATLNQQLNKRLEYLANQLSHINTEYNNVLSQLNNIQWNTLTTDQQVSACYDVLITVNN